MSDYFDNDLLNFSRVVPFVSGIMKMTKSNWKTIAIVNTRNTVPGPMVENRVGISEGIIAASTQCVELPNDCPDARR